MARDDSMAVLAEGLAKRFGDFVAVDGIDLRVPYGDIYGFLGPNGAGKTTTIRMLLGLLRPTGGRAWVLGHDIVTESDRVKAGIGYMSQRFSLYGDLSVLENLEFFGRTYGVTGTEGRARRTEALAMTGLAGSERVLARSLAGGYRQRLALACAILHGPRVLFLDEPTAGVDPISRRGFWDYLYDLAAEGRTIFVTTHYMDEAENCQQLAFINDGRIVAEGSPTEIKTTMAGTVLELDCDRPDMALAALVAATTDGRVAAREVALYGTQIHVVVDEPQAARTAIGTVLGEAGVTVRALDAIAPSLEDVFISTVRMARREVEA
jgi:ABC-2 type transport system ATP-binding protein